MRVLICGISLLWIVSGAAIAGQSGPIRSEVGFVDETSGARVEAVEPQGDGEYRVLVSVPRGENTSPTVIEEIVVSASRDTPGEAEEPVPAPRYELVKDYANDRYGLYVYLGKNREWPFRLFFKDHSAAEIHNY